MSNSGLPNFEFSTSGSGFHRFIGLSLSGKLQGVHCRDRILPQITSTTKIYDRIVGDINHSADQKIIEILESYKESIEYISVDTPFQQPLCIIKLKCPGYEVCKVDHIVWMRKQIQKKQKKKKVKKQFTPYTKSR